MTRETSNRTTLRLDEGKDTDPYLICEPVPWHVAQNLQEILRDPSGGEFNARDPRWMLALVRHSIKGFGNFTRNGQPLEMPENASVEWEPPETIEDFEGTDALDWVILCLTPDEVVQVQRVALRRFKAQGDDLGNSPPSSES